MQRRLFQHFLLLHGALGKLYIQSIRLPEILQRNLARIELSDSPASHVFPQKWMASIGFSQTMITQELA